MFHCLSLHVVLRLFDNTWSTLYYIHNTMAYKNHSLPTLRMSLYTNYGHNSSNSHDRIYHVPYRLFYLFVQHQMYDIVLVWSFVRPINSLKLPLATPLAISINNIILHDTYSRNLFHHIKRTCRLELWLVYSFSCYRLYYHKGFLINNIIINIATWSNN